MYYTEEIINGVLCFKTTPDGEWQPLSLTVMTERLEAANKRIDHLLSELFEYQ